MSTATRVRKREAVTSPHQSFFIPTYQITLVTVYFITLALGLIYSHTDPTRSYFSSKRNILNVVFVKQGWIWTTGVWAANLYAKSRTDTKALTQAFTRWSIATFWWILITQWFLGPSLSDRINVMTGGMCEIPMTAQNTDAKVLFTQAACRASEGLWKHGHDLSGHTFFLVHASLFLWEEVFTFAQGPSSATESSKAPNTISFLDISRKLTMGLLAIWWWMLLMTAVYFHTTQEKLTGFVVSLFSWAIVYCYLLYVPAMKQVLGEPPLQTTHKL